MEVPVQKACLVFRGLVADHVHGPLPQLRLIGVLRRTHPLGRGPRLIFARPRLGGHRQPVDAQQLVGQQFSTPVGPLIAQAHGPGQQGHQQGRMVAVLRCRVHGHQPGRGHARAVEQTQNGCLASQQALRVANVEGIDEGPQDQRPSTVPPTDVQPPHLRRPASAQRRDILNPFRPGQSLLHPAPCRAPPPVISTTTAVLGPLVHSHGYRLPTPSMETCGSHSQLLTTTRRTRQPRLGSEGARAASVPTAERTRALQADHDYVAVLAERRGTRSPGRHPSARGGPARGGYQETTWRRGPRPRSMPTAEQSSAPADDATERLPRSLPAGRKPLSHGRAVAELPPRLRRRPWLSLPGDRHQQQVLRRHPGEHS